uniref:Putative lipocalin-7 1 n=1 Tax=Rhipicephalus microplus TaxID=6941 RepID=A0A6M2CR14_RHIMP
MATSAVLIVLALAMVVSSLDLHTLIQNPSLFQYQDPSRFITNKSEIYLLRASIPAHTARLIPPTTPCVRSRYWANDTEKVERSLDVYNKTNPRGLKSYNISLTVEKHDWTTILYINPHGQNITILNFSDVYMGISTRANKTGYLVLFSDANCLILAETLKTASIRRPWLRCTMWVTTNRLEKPPKCCQFVFELLCAYLVDSVNFSDKSCLNYTQKHPSTA